MMQAALERAFERLAFGPEVDPADAQAVRDWLADSGVPTEDIEAILESGAWRLMVYRRLILGSLHQMIDSTLPLVRARLGDRFESYVGRFLTERGPRSTILRHVSAELIAFCEPLWLEDDQVSDWMLDLARYELTRHEIAWLDTKPVGQDAGEVVLDLPIRFIEASRLLRLRWAVHLIAENPDDHEAQPERRTTPLLVYRNTEHVVRYLELTPLAGAIVERLMGGQTLRQGISQACLEAGHPPDASTVRGAAKLLADLGERGILLGAAD